MEEKVGGYVSVPYEGAVKVEDKKEEKKDKKKDEK